MVKSMTGFGKGEATLQNKKITVEIRSLNSKQLDLSIKMPKKFNYFEAAMRTLLKDYIQRGKVDVFITYEDYTEDQVSLKYNSTLAAEYMKNFEKMAEQFGLEDDVTVSMLSRCPEVLTMEQVPDDEEHLWEILSEALKEAAVKFVESREIEGEHLKKDLLGKLDYMETLVDFIEERSPQILTEYRNRLEDKVKELLSNTAMEESRIAAEVTIYADKICVDEETVRLRSHIHNTRNELLSGESVGRKLDFIAQEMNREANTIGSKANDTEQARTVVEIKAELEKRPLYIILDMR